MKPKLLALVSLLAVATIAHGQTAAGLTPAQAHREALSAERAGDYAKARTLAEFVLKAEPNHFATRDLMARLDQQEARAKANAPRAALDAVKVEQVRLVEVTVPDAIQYLRGVSKESGINFVIIDPERKLNERIVEELTLQNTTAAVILEYVAQLAGLRVKYTDRTVEIRAGGNT